MLVEGLCPTESDQFATLGRLDAKTKHCSRRFLLQVWRIREPQDRLAHETMKALSSTKLPMSR